MAGFIHLNEAQLKAVVHHAADQGMRSTPQHERIKANY